MKKILFGFLVLFTTVLTACTSMQEIGFKLSSNEDVLSFQALIASSLLPKTEAQPLSAQNDTLFIRQLSLTTETDLETDPVTDPVTDPEDNDPILDNIDPYIELLEQLLGLNQGLTVETGISTIEGYQFMMSFQTTGLLGETQVYVIHYNMTLESEDEDLDDDEQEFILDGIMIVGDQTYTLYGEREIEEGKDEIEFTATLDDLNYVESSFELESDETKFEIKVVLNGEIVSETSIEIETEEDELEIKLEFLSGLNEGTYEFKYEIENGDPVLIIEFDVEIDGISSSGEMTLLILVDEVTGETYYKAYIEPNDGDAYEKEIPREIDDEDDEDETEDNEESDDEFVEEDNEQNDDFEDETDTDDTL